MRPVHSWPAANRRRSPILAFVSAVLFAVIGAGPVLADVEQGHRGTVGFHDLRDGAKGGVVCRYRETVPAPSGYDYEAELKWIDVRPPKVRAISEPQRVGWKFLIERRDVGGDWRVVYKSSTQSDLTSSTTNASFAMMGAAVNVPADSADDTPQSAFRVQVKMFWYASDGTIQGSAKHLVERYKSILGNADGTHPTISVDPSPCAGWQAFSVG